MNEYNGMNGTKNKSLTDYTGWLPLFFLSDKLKSLFNVYQETDFHAFLIKQLRLQF